MRTIDLDQRELVEQTAVWLQSTDVSREDLGLSVEAALAHAPGFLEELRQVHANRSQPLNEQTIDLLRACIRLIGESEGIPLEHADNAYKFIQTAAWPEPDFGERKEALADCAFQAWRCARRSGEIDAASRWAALTVASVEDALPAIFGDLHREDTAARKLESDGRIGQSQRSIESPSERLPRFAGKLGQPEVLLAICQLLDRNLEAEPARVMEDAEFFYKEVEGREADSTSFLFDERDYFLGELALLAGTAGRVLGRRDQARTCFDRAEAWFLLTSNSQGDRSRVAYQRLALKIEEGRFDEVLRTVRPVLESFDRLRAPESSLKCKVLEAIAYKETNQLPEALKVFRSVLEDARAIGSARLLSSCYVNIVQIHAISGETDAALMLAKEALPLLRTSNNRKDIAKLQWGIANLLRVEGRLSLAIDAFRVAQKEFLDLEMPGDVAAIQLLIADLLLESGQEAQAEWEIRAALPVIDELKMVPEGVAALSLLRESVRRRKIDRQALRDLHGYFDEIQG